MSYGNYPDLSKVKKILVIRMRHLGDVLLTTPLLTVLKRAVPQAVIDVMINQESYPILEGNSCISNYILYDRKEESLFKKLKKEWQLYKKVRAGKYDLVLNMTEGDRGAIAAFISGAAYKVGFDPSGKGFKGKAKIFTHLVKKCPTPRHAVERQLDVARCLGIIPREEDKELVFNVPGSAFKSHGLVEGRYIVIHPGSRWRFKCWPVEQVVALIKELDRLGHQVVLSGGLGAFELAMVQEIIEKTPGISICNLAGKLSLKELGALLMKSQALISVDTVTAHMATALKVPLVVLFGPSSEQEWGPWMHPKSVVVTKNLTCRPCLLDGCGGSKRSECLYSLQVTPVLNALQALGI